MKRGIILLLSLTTAACYPTPATDGEAAFGREVDIAWGRKVYERNCARCHDTGANGAQVIGDVEGWRSRIARGLPSLVANAIEGYSGALGYMPPRGGNPSLSHEDVTAATVYIVTESRADKD